MTKQPTPNRQRAFTLVLALVAFALASAVLTWSLSRLSLRAVAASANVDTYRRHHDALSYRDIAKLWTHIARDEQSATLAAIAQTPGPHFAVTLPTGVTLQFYVRDTQNRLMTNFARIESPEDATRVIEAINRIPDDRGDLVRQFGSPRVSIYTADDILIDALTPNKPDIAQHLREYRDSPRTEDTPAILGSLVLTGINRSDAIPIARLFTDEPTLFAVDIRAVPPLQPQGLARRSQTEFYSVELEMNDAARVAPLSWRQLSEEEFSNYHKVR